VGRGRRPQLQESLRLSTPARYSSLPGMRSSAPAGYSPTKDEMANLLEVYASHFDLFARPGVRVDALTRKAATC
jgi:putative flavoprotein involved in K+ transport